MRPSRFSDAQMQHAIAEVADGTPLITVCRRLGVTPTTFYRWRDRFAPEGGLSGGEVRDLRAENLKLKELVANLSLERQFLMETIEKHGKDARRGRDA